MIRNHDYGNLRISEETDTCYQSNFYVEPTSDDKVNQVEDRGGERSTYENWASSTSRRASLRLASSV